MKFHIIFLVFFASYLFACAGNESQKKHNDTDKVEIEEELPDSNLSFEDIEETSETDNVSETDQRSDQRPLDAKEVVETVKESNSSVKIVEKPEQKPKTENKVKDVELTDSVPISTVLNEKTTKDSAREEKANQPAPLFSHDKWDELLRKHVTSTGKVNYKGFKSEKAKLDAYLKELSDNPPATSWSKNKQLAYWINVYNAFTVDLIVRNYPLKSIQDLNEPWKTRFFKIGTRDLSLNEVENEIIRKQFNDARIHFAVNCASVSCPALLNRAYTEANLDSQLDRQTRSYINNPIHNTITSRKAEVSQLFNWYEDDFKKETGSVRAFINKYSEQKIGEKVKIEFREYDWGLNE
ncbi:MAG: DUF547 domain-containing protein, partial [Bacteroidetes bacterium]|nr:DUF547 domain-containing protein [Bacteroidota bacterium]